MAYWHYPDGTPAPPFKGRFDSWHLMPVLYIALIVLLMYLREKYG